MNLPPSKPKSYSSEDIKVQLIEQQNIYLKESIDDLAEVVNKGQENIKQLSNLVTSLSEKVAVLNDIFYKGLGALFLIMMAAIIAWFFKK